MNVCGVCGIPHQDGCRMLRRHLEYLRLLGRSSVTVYTRQRAIMRLANWLGKHCTVTVEARCAGSKDPSSQVRDVPVCVADASADDLYAWRSALRVADATAACELSHIKQLYRWLAATGVRTDDPSANLPVPTTPRRLPRPISEPDLMRALDSAPDRLRLMVVLMGWCGLRCKEVGNLRREHLKDTGDVPVVVVVIGAAKGRKERAIPLSPFVVAEIQAANLPRTGYVFSRKDGERGPMAPWMVSKLIGEHLHDLGIAATAHQLRHRCLSQAYNTSGDVIGTQEIAGHASLSSTTGYVKLSGKRTREIVDGIPTPPKLYVVRDDAG